MGEAKVAHLGQLPAQSLLEDDDIGVGQVLHRQAEYPRVGGNLEPPVEVVDVGLDVVHLVHQGDLVSNKFHELGDLSGGADRSVDSDQVVVQTLPEDRAWLKVGLESGEVGHYV